MGHKLDIPLAKMRASTMRVAILAPPSIEQAPERELGPPRTIRNFAAALREKEELEITALRVRLTPCSAEFRIVDGLKVAQCWFGNVASVLRKLDPDILQSFSTTSTSVVGFNTGLAAKSLGAAWIDTVLGLVRLEARQGYPHAPQSALFEQLRLSNADSVVFPSQLGMNAAIRAHGKGAWRAARVIPLGIERHWLQSGHWYDHAAHAEANRHSLRIACVGVVAPHKGQDLLLEAFRMSSMPGTLELVGPEVNPKFARALRMSANALRPGKHLVFKGFLTAGETIQTLLHANVFGLLSRFDLFPAAALEAMAVGHAPLLSAGVGCSELIEPMRSGYVVASNEPSQAAENLERIGASFEEHVARGMAANRVSEKLDFSNMASRYVALYQELVARR